MARRAGEGTRPSLHGAETRLKPSGPRREVIGPPLEDRGPFGEIAVSRRQGARPARQVHRHDRTVTGSTRRTTGRRGEMS